MRIDSHGAPAHLAHPGAGLSTSTARPMEGSRLLASGRLGTVLIAAAHAALAHRAEAVVRHAGIPATLESGDDA